MSTTSIEPFVTALERTLDIMSGPTMTKGAVERCVDTNIVADVSAHIAVHGVDSFYCIILTATETAARELVRFVAGVDASLDDTLTADTLGEVLNVIVGSAQKGGGYQFSIPVIAKARAHTVRVAGSSAYDRVVSRTPTGEISLYLVEGTVASEAAPSA